MINITGLNLKQCVPSKKVKVNLVSLMTIKIMRLLTSLVLVVFCGLACSKEPTGSRSGVGSVAVKPTKVYSEAELNKLITVGMAIEDVTNIFGLPGSAVNEGENRIHLRYMFRIDPNQTISGFGIDIKNGLVVRWDAIRQGTGHILQDGGSQGSLGEQTFEMFFVTSDLTNIAKAVDSQGSADASNLKVSPDMVFKAKVFSGDSGSGHSGEQSVILVVGEQESLKLKDITESNLGKRLLIVCRNRAIAAPLISVPLASRQLEFTVKDSNVLKNIQD